MLQMSDGQSQFESLHMTDEEVQEVVKLHEENRKLSERLQSMATVGDVSEAMAVPESEVATLLAEVRRRKAEQDQAQAHVRALEAEANVQYRRANSSRQVRTALILVAFFVAMAIAMFASMVIISPTKVVEQPSRVIPQPAPEVDGAPVRRAEPPVNIAPVERTTSPRSTGQ